eukprot:scaffold56446_cov59-Cyclotella_meneghiniana.AAC.1
MAGLELVRGDDSGAIVDPKQIFQYRSLTAVNMYVMQWSRPEIYNATRGQSRMMQKPQPTHMNALKRLCHYVVGTPNRGLVLHPDRAWDGSTKAHKFRIRG